MRNARLEQQVAMVEAYAASGQKQREIGEFASATEIQDPKRRGVARLEHSAQGNNPAFVVCTSPNRSVVRLLLQ